MKKNYSMPQLEVSEMKAGALLQSSNQTPVSGSTIPGGGISAGGGTVPTGTGGGAKTASNHFEF